VEEHLSVIVQLIDSTNVLVMEDLVWLLLTYTLRYERSVFMQISGNPLVDALIGGLFIGLASALLLLGKGRIFGISGIIAGLLSPGLKDLTWRLVIILGLVLGGLPIYLTLPEKFSNPFAAIAWMPAVAGLLVGFGTQLGSGCTSGHGVCGISRFSSRSIVATITFMLTGIATVYFVH
jgi:uncharacterized membrane protein YedE/YeeE